MMKFGWKGWLIFFAGIIVGAGLQNNRHYVTERLPETWNQLRADIEAYQTLHTKNQLLNSLKSHEVLLPQGLANPIDVVFFEGKWVFAEMMRNRLVAYGNDTLTSPSILNPKEIGEQLRSPHFLEPTNDGKLLIAEGWGTGIVRIDQLKGSGWVRFEGQVPQFNAPHGVCMDSEGWIYVGDSLNSRLVRFRDMEGSQWQVFTDENKVIAYARELVCAPDGVWVANSYENREGLNPGKGAAILQITDFSSGKAKKVFELPHTNVTGMSVLDDQVLWGEWGAGNRLVLGDKDSGHWVELLPNQNLGVPYGMSQPDSQGRVWVTYFGSFEGESTPGGVVRLQF